MRQCAKHDLCAYMQESCLRRERSAGEPDLDPDCDSIAISDRLELCRAEPSNSRSPRGHRGCLLRRVCRIRRV